MSNPQLVNPPNRLRITITSNTGRVVLEKEVASPGSGVWGFLLDFFEPAVGLELQQVEQPVLYRLRSDSGTANLALASVFTGEGQTVAVTEIIATGTPSSSNFLRGDGTWTTVSGSAAWGGITGTVADQTDLQAELDGKADTSHTHAATDISDSTAAGRTLLTAANAAAQRTALNVEDGATADQSAAEILAAIVTVDGASSGLDADLLDGAEGAAYLLKTNLASGSITARADDVDFSGGSTGHVWTVQADGSVAFAAQAGGGDMSAATYDPQAIADDAFDRANHTGTQDFSTIDNRALASLSADVQLETLGSIANNEVLAFDTSTGKFINQTPSEAGLQAELSTSYTARSTNELLDFSAGVDGDVWTVQADGSVAFETASAHTHVKADITDFEIQTIDVADDAITGAKMADTAVTPGSYSNTSITVDQQGRITAASSGTAGAGLTTSLDSNTAIDVDDDDSITHKMLTSGSAITLTLQNDASVGTRCAFTPSGAGAVTVAVEAGAGFWLDGDNVGGTARTTSFPLYGYGYFEVFRNTGGTAAEWFFKGTTSHPKALYGNISEQYYDAGNKTGAATFSWEDGGWQKCVATGNITSVTISNPPAAGRVAAITLEVHQDGAGSKTIAWGAAFRFPGGTDFVASTAAGAIDIFTFISRDGGTTWYGFSGGIGMAA